MKIQIIYFLFIFCYYVYGQDCEHFAKINGGEIIYDRDDAISIPNGAKAILKCHATKFETTSTCIDGNWDPPSLGYCSNEGNSFAVAKRQEHHQQQQPSKHSSNSGCPTLEAPSHSFLTYFPLSMAPYPTGTMANLNCFLGFSPIGQTAAECKDGQWSSIGNCQPVSVQRCPPIAPISHGMINYIPGGNGPYDYGSIAELTCGFGHSVAGNNRVTCESTGWAPAIGHCEQQKKNVTTAVARSKRQWGVGTNTGIGCTAQMAINGQVSYVQANPSIPYSSGTTALLICNMGFTPSGSASSYCQNGQWQPQLGQCYQGGFGGGNNGNIGNPGNGQQQCLPIGSMVMNGQISYSTGNPFGPFPSGSSANVQCNMGYMVSGSSSAICQNGQWQPSILGTCNQNGLGGGIGGTQPGWGNTGAVCFAIPLPLNGQVQYSTGSQQMGQYQQGTTATLYCNSGTVSGSSFSQCSNGMWYPPIGSCNSFGGIGGNNGLGGIGGTGGVGQCTFGMLPPLGGTIQYSGGSTFGPWPQGSSATLICNGGTPQGQSTAQCMNGAWQPSSFQGCTTNGGLGGIGGGFPGSTGTQCYSAMPTVVGGQINYSSGSTFGPFNSGTMATLMCTNGQMPQGQTTASCQNGQWNPPMFTGCSGNNGLGGIGGIGGGGAQCFASLLAPLNGQIRYSTGSTFGPFPSGTTASLTCNQGYSPQGTSSASCINGQFNPPTLGQCVAGNGLGGIGGGIGGSMSNCYALPQPANGQITYTSLPQNNAYPLGTSATLTCYGGYQAMGSSSAFCQQSGWSAFVLGQSAATTKEKETTTSKEKMPENCEDSPLPLLSNGRLETTSGDPSKAKVVCHDGFSSHVSEISIFCQNGEIRTRQSAACVSPSPTSTATTSASGAAATSGGGGNFVGCKLPVSHVERGQILYSTGTVHSSIFPPGTIATLICEFGNSPIGGSTMTTCVEGGWSQRLASCRPPSANNNNQCQALAKVPGGHITYSEIFNTNGPFNSGTFATLMCEFGRSLIGPATVTCRNGTWDSIGICQNPAELPTSGGGSFLAPQKLIPPPTARCPPIKSPSLKSTLEFDQTPLADGNYPNSTVAHLICLEDNASITNGVSEAECIKGIWLPKLGECSPSSGNNGINGKREESDIEREEKTFLSGPGNCQPIESPPKGRVAYIQSGAKNTYQVGSTAILNCDIGYSVSGHAALSCAPGGTWLPANGFGKCLSNTDLVH